ncbi:MAG: tetraacyldisaccharide 4'-kinase [Methylophilaceae bacterium]
MKSLAQDLLLHAWQKKNALFYLILVPLSWIFGALTALRRSAYKCGIFKSHALTVPTIVVGNLNLGGSGKTPVVMWLVEQLKLKGFKPGVISRGYGANVVVPTSVSAKSHASEVGDEPLLIAKRCACPVFVSASRVKAGVAMLNAHPECDLVISDDGLQHYQLQRNIEIAVVNNDALESAYLLPAGPMRESASRLNTVDAVVCNGNKTIASAYKMQLVGTQFYNLQNPNLKATVTDFADKKIKAIAAIGKPARFFEHLRGLGLTFAGMGFDDHHAFTAQDLAKLDCDLLIMTEKDAVKCQAFAQTHYWVLPVEANIDVGLLTLVLDKIAKK